MDENIGSPHFARPPKETYSICPELAKATISSISWEDLLYAHHSCSAVFFAKTNQITMTNVFPGSQRPLKKSSPGIIDYKSLLNDLWLPTGTLELLFCTRKRHTEDEIRPTQTPTLGTHLLFLWLGVVPIILLGCFAVFPPWPKTRLELSRGPDLAPVWGLWVEFNVAVERVMKILQLYKERVCLIGRICIYIYNRESWRYLRVLLDLFDICLGLSNLVSSILYIIPES